MFKRSVFIYNLQLCSFHCLHALCLFDNIFQLDDATQIPDNFYNPFSPVTPAEDDDFMNLETQVVCSFPSPPPNPQFSSRLSPSPSAVGNPRTRSRLSSPKKASPLKDGMVVVDTNSDLGIKSRLSPSDSRDPRSKRARR
jgi:hypothetical protein